MQIKENTINFIINDSEKIEVVFSDTLDISDGIFRYDVIHAYYTKNNEKQYVIYRNDFIIEFTRVLNTACKRLLDTNESSPSISFEQDPGHLWNKRLHEANKDDTIRIYNWEYAKYILWDLSTTSSWLYEKSGNFFFEITPLYEWHFRRPKAQEKTRYIPYKEFMANYKPCIITPISRERVLEWLQQTKEILALIDLYDDKYLVRT